MTSRYVLWYNWDATGRSIIAAQQTFVAQLPTSQGTAYIWMGDRWGSTPDGVKGHDFQSRFAWMSPNTSGPSRTQSAWSPFRRTPRGSWRIDTMALCAGG
jgi:hypothetical protein